jgi:hypothetical protein
MAERERIYDVARMIFPCHGGCGRMTRPTRWPAEKFPDTIVRANGKHCHSCRDRLGLNPTRVKKPQPAPATIEHIIAGLERWQARRRRDAERFRTRHLTY